MKERQLEHSEMNDTPLNIEEKKVTKSLCFARGIGMLKNVV